MAKDTPLSKPLGYPAINTPNRMELRELQGAVLAARQRIEALERYIGQFDLGGLSAKVQNSAGGAGSVTSVNMTVPDFMTVSGVPLTRAGTIALGFAPEAAGTFLAGPLNSPDSAPTFRPIDWYFDIPLFSSMSFISDIDGNDIVPIERYGNMYWTTARAIASVGAVFYWDVVYVGDHTLTEVDIDNGVVLRDPVGTQVVYVPADDQLTARDGAAILVYSEGGADVHITGVSGVNVEVRSGLLPQLAGEFAIATLIKRGPNDWILAGDLVSTGGSSSGGSGTTSPLTTKGDVWGYSTTDARIPIGADAFVLTADSTQPLGLKWAAQAAGLTSPLTTKGDLWGWSTTNARLPVGANNFVLTADSTQTLGVKWAAALASPLTTKGDLWGFSTLDARLPVGANDQTLVADSTQALGVRWGSLALPVFTWNTFSGNHTLATADLNCGLASVDAGSVQTITVPADAQLTAPVGTSVLIYGKSTSVVQVVPVSGVNIDIRSGLLPELAGQYAIATLIKYAADSWLLCGDLYTSPNRGSNP